MSSLSKTLKTVNAFIFNEHGMCENPEEIKVYQSGKDYLIIELAQAPDGTWCEGVSHQCYNGGGGHAAGFGKYRTKYPTREAALIAALQNEIKSAEEDSKRPGKEGERHKKMKVALQSYLNTLTQPSLFYLFD